MNIYRHVFTATCPNNGQNVVVKRMVVGNPAVYTTTFGNPTSAIIGSQGMISSANYLTNASVRAPAFSAVMTLNAGEYAYVAEAYFQTTAINMPGYRDNTYVYQRNIF